MRHIQEYAIYEIAGCLLAALFNNDPSGLEDRDIAQLDSFMDRLQAGAKQRFGMSATTTVEFPTGQPYFGKCDVTYLHAEVYTVKVYVSYEEVNDGPRVQIPLQ